MDLIIADNQTTFIRGRQILDDILILNETLDEAKKNKIMRIFFKVDFAKAFDSVVWSYLDRVMEGFAFCDRWRMWIRGCVQSATTSVLVNGSSSGKFSLERGLRQGDPLLPFLFLLAAEGLGLLITKACTKGLLSPAVIGKDKVVLSYLQYADDAVFVCKSGVENVCGIKRILCLLELVSGLKVNFSKCKLFGVSVSEVDLTCFADLLGYRIEKGQLTYLGMQVGINSHRKEA